MAVAGLFWHSGRKLPGQNHLDPRGSEGYDLHVVRNTTSKPLTEILRIRNEQRRSFPANALPSSLGVTKVEFIPNFKEEQTVGTSVVKGHGISVNTSNGSVEVLREFPTKPRLSNFLIIAKVHHNTPNVANPLELPIRVHAHKEVIDLWLTPSTLTIAQGADGQQFSVLARFDDETIGDISRLPGTTWTPPPQSSQDIIVAANGAITVNKNPSQQEVTATLPPGWGGKQVTAMIKGVRPWSDQPSAIRAATLVSGPGANKLDEVPNVLFVSEGFTDSEKDDFDELVQNLVASLRFSKVTRPFDLFVQLDRINCWSVFIPSAERGASALHEFATSHQPSGDVFEGDAVPNALKPSGTSPWRIEELIYQVGLPIPSDVQEDDFNKKTEDWKKLFGDKQVPASQIKERVFIQWRNQTLRTLANERDTALGVALGERPRVMRRDPPRFLGLHPFRTTRDHLDQFLATLTDGEGGRVIGTTWAKGKDRELVMALVAGARLAGAYSRGNLVAASLVPNDRFQIKRVENARGWDIEPYPLPPRNFWRNTREIGPVRFGTIVHELAHAFGLGDEYGQDGFRLPDHEIEYLLENGNVQAGHELESTSSSDDLDGQKLLWRWPRIKKAGVLAAPPKPKPGLPGVFSIQLKPGHQDQLGNTVFQPGDIVFLRQRPLLKPPESAAPGTSPQRKKALESPPLEVVSPTEVLSIDEIQVRVVSGTLKPMEFPAVSPNESILFMAVTAPDYAKQLGDLYAELAARVVRDHITAKGPLNRQRTAKCAVDDNEVQPAKNRPNLSFSWSPSYRIVGAYDGGASYYCGVYHPTGICLMRGQYDTDLTLTTEFCPVCRYLLVDRIDPTLHPIIDADYAPIYPEPKP